MKAKPIKDFPVLKGLVNYSGNAPTICVWCPFCRAFHTHGWTVPPSKSEKQYGTHRVAHCFNPDSPFNDGGYYVKEFSKEERAGMFSILNQSIPCGDVRSSDL